MDYGLTRVVLGSTGFIELSADEYAKIVRSKDDLYVALNIEELLDLVLGNYLELETDLLAIAARSMVHHIYDYDYIHRERNFIVNRRFLNLLSACRGYLDQTDHHLNTIIGRADITAAWLRETYNTSRSREYDSFLAYRVMEALRNYTQHRAFPISTTYDHRWVGDDDTKKNISSFIPYIEVDKLDSNFKESIRNELRRTGERKLDLRPMIRQYIGSIGSIHENVREILKPYIEECESTVREAIERYANTFPSEKTMGLAAVKRGDRGEYVESVSLFMKSIEYRRALERKNCGLATLSTRVVTSGGI